MASRSYYAATGILPLHGVGVSDDLSIIGPVLTTHRWGVIWWYTELGCIEKLSTDGIPLDELSDELLQRQTNALIASGCLEVEADTAMERSRNEEDNGQEVRSIKVMHRQFQHQEAEE